MTRAPALGVLLASLLWLIPGPHGEGEDARIAAADGRLLVVISDLHLGVGPRSQAWHPMEDFRWGPEFRLFLDEVERQGEGRTDLVIAGDAFELWQSLADDCRAPDPDLGCTGQEAVERLSRVVRAHGDELRALGAFAGRRDNRVVLVPGNHDAALLFPAVAEAAVRAMQAPPGRVRVEPRGYWLSADGQVLVEHGQQIGRDLNKFAGWPRPFTKGATPHLERPWGEQFVQAFYNQYEVRYPIIDNVSEEGVGIRYAREVEGWTGAAKAFGRFLAFYLLSLSDAQQLSTLGPAPEPGPGGDASASPWDLAAVRAQGRAFILDSLPADEPLGRAARRADADTQIDATLHELSDDELREICDARALIEDARRAPAGGGAAAAAAAGAGAAITTGCPAKEGTLGALAQAVSRRSASAVLARYLVDRYRALKDSGAATRPFTVYLYGHTHLADSGFSPMADSYPDWNPRVLNTGAWQRVVTPADLERLRCLLRPDQSPIELQPEQLPACYSAVFVRPYGGSANASGNVNGSDARPRPELLFWGARAPDQWSLASTCPWTPPCPGASR
jgi:UDP-2,3-diacylglucosamine pyrophosphatase LpxH